MELGSLRLELRDLLGENFVEVPQPVVLNEVAGARPGSRLQVSADHLEFLCRSVRERFERLIQRQIDEYNSVVGTTAAGLTPELLRSLQRENDEHARFAAERAPEGSFLGRQDELKRIRDYIDGRRAADDGQALPFVLAGPSGSGKSAVMAAAAREVRNRSANWSGDAIVIERYLGTTRHSSDIRSLLTDLCCSLRHHFPVDAPLPTDIRLLGKEFYAQLENANAFAPIVIFLDALDQLDSADDALRLWWIRSTPLPEGVRIILSCATDVQTEAEPHPWEILNQRGFVRAGNSHLVQELSTDDATNLWNTWMAAAGRSLTVSQQAVVDERIVRGPGACRQPLYLRVLFEEARQWYSWHQPPVPAQTVNELLMQVLERLRLPERHGPLVEPALSCLVAAKYGLTENELLEILFRDREYKSEFMQSAFHKLPEGADRVPIAIWSGLRHDLAPYLTERGAPGGVVLQFFHRQVANAVRGLFTRNSEQKARRHRQLILYFARQHWWLEPRSEQRKRMSPPYSARPVNVRKVTELPEHLIQFVRSAQLGNSEFDTACRWLEKTFQNIEFLEAKNEAGRVFELAEDFSRAVPAIPDSRPEHRVLRLLEEALRRDIDFIDRHSSDYPQGLFQCLWNSCWWYDCPVAAVHYHSEQSPGAGEGLCLYRLLESWQTRKQSSIPEIQWVRAVRPPSIHLGSALRAIFSGHDANVTAVSYHPDGKKIASGSKDRTVRLWDTASGQPLLLFTGHEGAITSVCFSPDGQRLASASEDQTVRIWDSLTGSQLVVCSGHTKAVTCICFSPDGQRIVSGSHDTTLQIWEVSNGCERVELNGHQEGITSVCFSPDGHKIVSGSLDKTVRMWEARTGSSLAQFRVHESGVTSVLFTPDGTRIISGSKDFSVRVIDVATQMELQSLQKHECDVTSICCSPDGKRIASASLDSTIRIWDVFSGRELAVLSENPEASMLHVSSGVNCVTFSPDGRWVAGDSSDKNVRVWDTAGIHRALFIKGHEALVSSVCFSPDDRRIASGSFDSSIRIWDAVTGLQLAVLQGHSGLVCSLDYSPDGRRIVSGGTDSLRVWDAYSGFALGVLEGHNGKVLDVAFSPDGSTIVSSSSDKTIRIWDALEGSEVAVLFGHEDSVTRVQFSEDGQQLVSASADGTVRVWNRSSWACLEILRGDQAVSRIRRCGLKRRIVTRIRGSETMIQGIDRRQSIAWFPEVGIKTAANTEGTRWAICTGRNVSVITLNIQIPSS